MAFIYRNKQSASTPHPTPYLKAGTPKTTRRFRNNNFGWGHKRYRYRVTGHTRHQIKRTLKPSKRHKKLYATSYRLGSLKKKNRRRFKVSLLLKSTQPAPRQIINPLDRSRVKYNGYVFDKKRGGGLYILKRFRYSRRRDVLRSGTAAYTNQAQRLVPADVGMFGVAQTPWYRRGLFHATTNKFFKRFDLNTEKKKILFTYID